MQPRIAALGDAAITITLGEQVAPPLAHRAQRLARDIRRAGIGAVTDVVPAYATVTVYYDPLHLDHDALAARLRPLAEQAAGAPEPAAGTGREHHVPVRYDGADLAEVARRTGLAPHEVAALHAAPTYEVLLLGFVPGFAYLGELDERLVLARRAEPRVRVPAGAVAIAGRQTAVYPLATPGGWHLIGRTDVPLFDARADPPALLAAGDRVRFVPVDGA